MSKMVSQAYQLHPVSLIYDVGQAKKNPTCYAPADLVCVVGVSHPHTLNPDFECSKLE